MMDSLSRVRNEHVVSTLITPINANDITSIARKTRQLVIELAETPEYFAPIAVHLDQ